MRRDRVFISYRRSDVPETVRELRAALTERFGEQAVFQDTEAMRPGEVFPARLNNELARAAFVLIVIGPHWNGSNEHGAGGLANPHDWVRIEVETALNDRDAEVIPVLIDRTPIPSSESLPESLSGLPQRNAINLSRQNFGSEIAPLIARLSERISPMGSTGEPAALRLAVRDELGSVLAAHVWALWHLLLPHRDDPLFSFDPPTGFRNEDVRALSRALQWLTGITAADSGWWRDVTIVVTADAVVWVASDLMDRFRPPDEADSQSEAIETIHDARRTAVKRLTEIATRLNELGDRGESSETSNAATALRTLDTPKSYMVPLDAYIRREDHVDIIGGRPFEFMRAEVSWLADLLRPDAIEVDRLGEPLEVSPPSPSIYRWGRLLRAEDLTATVWKTRFGEGSWFRGVMQRARDEYPSGMLGSLVKEPGN